MQASPRPVLMQVPLAMPSLPKRLPRPVGIRRRPRHCTKLGQSNLGLGFAGLMDFHTSLGWFKQAPFQCEHCFGASGFQLSQAVCSSDFDREYVTSAICRWYGSPAARLMFLKARVTALQEANQRFLFCIPASDAGRRPVCAQAKINQRSPHTHLCQSRSVYNRGLIKKSS